VQKAAPVQDVAGHAGFLEEAYELLRDRCQAVQIPEDRPRSVAELERVRDEFEWKWDQNPQEWETYPPNVNVQYLMLWPGQYYTALQKRRGATVPSSMRQVDRSAELNITQGYAPAMPGAPAQGQQPAAGQQPAVAPTQNP
jgi:hypothetical protein